MISNRSNQMYWMGKDLAKIACSVIVLNAIRLRWKKSSQNVQSTCGHHPYRCSTVTVCYTSIALAFFLGDLIFEDERRVIQGLGVRHRYENLFETRASSKVQGPFGYTCYYQEVQILYLGTNFSDVF